MKIALCFSLQLVTFLFLIFQTEIKAQIFSGSVQYSTGSNPYSVAVGDFDGDSESDLAVANYGSDSVSILLGNGNGTFQDRADYSTGSVPFSVAVGDFNGDNKSDLAVANSVSNTVSILLGNGNGTFQVKADYSTGSGPSSVAIGDFNGDNKSDLAVANWGSNTVSILLGNGNGTFQDKVNYFTGIGPRSVAIGDFNGDNKSDLAVANWVSNSVSILLGNGNGTFQAKKVYSTGSGPCSVAIGDFNGDNKSDLAVANYGSDAVSILLGNGNGTFQAKVDYSTGAGPYSLAIGDFNGDNKLDLAVANWSISNTVSILLGNGDGTFQDKADYPTGSVPCSVAIGDFNGDNKSDLAVANYGSNTVSIFINQSASVPNTPPTSANGNKAVNEDNVLTLADFSYNDDEADPFNKLMVIWLPENGTLFKDDDLNSTIDTDEALSAYDEITKAELDANKLKFMPELNGNGTPYTIFNFKVSDGISYSSSLYTMTIDVTAINDAPVLANIEGTPLEYNENETKEITNTLTLTDVDDVNIESAVVQITGNYIDSEDVLEFTNTVSITGAWDEGLGKMTLTGSDTKANYQAALRDVKYSNTSQNPSTLQRTVSFTVNDGDANSNTVTRSINVTAVNDPPVLANIEGTQLNYTENDPATQITNTITVTDADDTNIESATVQITGNYQNGEDVLSFTNQNGITGNWNTATGTMALSGSAALANYQTALRDVKYSNTSQNPSILQRTVRFTVNDGTANSNTLTRNISVASVNSPPVIFGIETTPQEYKVKQGELQVTNSVKVEDIDNSNLEGATITISGNYKLGEDIIVFSDQNGITGIWDGNNGLLQLNGTESINNYQSALRSVKYKNQSLNPTNLERTISISVNDGNDISNTVSRRIVVKSTNIAPVINGVETDKLKFLKGNPPQVVSESILIEDPDNINLQGATIKIGGGLMVGEDVLEFSAPQNVQGTYNLETGTIELTGQQTLLGYQNILRSVKYKNIKGALATTSERTIEFTVKDGVAISNIGTRQIEVVSPLNAPTDLTVRYDSEGNIILSWTDNSDNEEGFIIFRYGWLSGSVKENRVNAFLPIDTVDVNVTEYVDRSVAEGTVYIYSVKAYNSQGITSDDTPANQISTTAPLKPPCELKAEVKDGGKVELCWKDKSMVAEECIIERSEGTANQYTVIGKVGINVCMFIDSNIKDGVKYYYRVCACKGNEMSNYSNVIEVVGVITEMEELAKGIPIEYKLYQNYPNPFNPLTTIRYAIPKESYVKIVVYNILGGEVARLVNRIQSAGYYEVQFGGSKMNSGIYIYKIEANEYTFMRKMILMK